MRNAARELPHRLHLLRLSEDRLHPLLLLNFSHQLGVSLGEFGGSLPDPPLQCGGELAPFFQVLTRHVLSFARPNGRRHAALQGLSVDGPLENDNVAEVGQGLLRALRSRGNSLRR